MLGSCNFQSGERAGIRAEFKFNKMNVPVLRKDPSRINVGSSSWDSVHKDSIRAALVLGRGASTIGKNPVRNSTGGIHSTLNTIRADMSGFKKCQRLPSDKQQISRNLTYPHIGNQEELFVPIQSSPTLMLEVPEWRTWAYTDDSCHIQNGKQEIGASVYCPLTDSKNFVEPKGAGITNTICRAE
eukprot:1156795-Pelagomonas_calceolata.AAC.1